MLKIFPPKIQKCWIKYRKKNYLKCRVGLKRCKENPQWKKSHKESKTKKVSINRYYNCLWWKFKQLYLCIFMLGMRFSLGKQRLWFQWPHGDWRKSLKASTKQADEIEISSKTFKDYTLSKKKCVNQLRELTSLYTLACSELRKPESWESQSWSYPPTWFVVLQKKS